MYIALESDYMAADRSNSKLQEDLVTLYLRLNGFFVSTFIVHSPVYGKNYTELDALAVRLPFSSEPERAIGPHALLDLSTKHTDLALCEVKSNGQPLRFNAALVGRLSAVKTVLRWSGLFEESEIEPLSSAFATALLPQKPPSQSPPTVLGPRGVRIRALLFSPERNVRQPKNEPWYITGPEAMRYAWQCLCPQAPRASCATTYDLHVWGSYEPIVRYFKSRDAEKGPGEMKDLYAFVKADGL